MIKSESNIIFFSSFLISIFLIFYNTWTGSFVNSDDLIYVGMAQEMVKTGNIFDLIFQGGIEHLRPPLAIWLFAVFGSIFGFSEFAMRLPCVITAILSLFFVTRITIVLFNDKKMAAFSILFLTASAIFYFNARRVMTDMIFILGMLIFIWSYFKSLEKPIFLTIMGVALGWIIMVKGVVSVIPVALVLSDMFLRNRFDLLKHRSFIKGAILALIIILPWHIIQSIRYGGDFWSEYIGFNVLQRASSSFFEEPDNFFYIERFIKDEGILSVFFLCGCCVTIFKFIKHKKPEDRFLLLWTLFAFIPFQISSTKIPHYMLPCYPVLVIMAAGAVVPVLKKSYLITGFFLAILGIFISNNMGDFLSPDYSHDQKFFAKIVSQNSSEDDTITVFNHYDLALFHYSKRKVHLVTDDFKMYSLLKKVPMFSHANMVELATIDNLLTKVSFNLFLLTIKPLENRIRTSMQASGKFSFVKAIPGNYLVLLIGSNKIIDKI